MVKIKEDVINKSNNSLSEEIDILCKRIIAKKFLKDEPLLFNVISGMEIPIDICLLEGECPVKFEERIAKLLLCKSSSLEKLIELDTPTDELISENEKLAKLICSLNINGKLCKEKPKCIKYTKFILCGEPTQEIICNKKLCITIKFKIFLVISFKDCRFMVMELPGDENYKFCFGENVHFPIFYEGEDMDKELSIDTIDKSFILKICMKFKDFKDETLKADFNNPSLQSVIKIKNIDIKYDITMKPCNCDTGRGTLIKLLVTADLLIKIGIEEEILVFGRHIKC